MTIEEIKIGHFPPKSCKVYKNKVYFATISNEYELNDLRIQIAKTRAEGFSIGFKDKIITIDNMGQLSKWPEGFYDTTVKQLRELFKIQNECRNNDNNRSIKQDCL